MRFGLRMLALAALGLAGTAAVAATPPAQPKEGPGGADYVATDVKKRAVGRASASTYVFHAAGTPDAPRPVVVFLHAWGAVNPQVYGGWIEHLARKGHLVLYPRFQELNRTRPADASQNAASLVKAALEALASDPEARPDPERVAYVGHLAGAAIAVNLAARAKADGLPVPKLVFAVVPGGVAKDEKSRGVALKDLSNVDPATMLITITGDRDHIPADRAARRIMREASAVPPERKLLMRALSDDHGFPALSATLASPGSPNPKYDAASIQVTPDPPRDPKQRPPQQRWSAEMALTGEQSVLVSQLQAATIDTLDYLAFWKTFDMAAAAAFGGRDAQSLRAMPRFLDMERWSDGWPVRRLAAETPKAEAAAPAGDAAPARPAPPSAKMPVPSRQR